MHFNKIFLFKPLKKNILYSFPEPYELLLDEFDNKYRNGSIYRYATFKKFWYDYC